MLKYFKWFFQFWSKAKYRMTGVFLMTILTILVKTAFPVMLKEIVDLLEQKKFDGIYLTIGLFTAMAVLHELVSQGLPTCRSYMNSLFAMMVRNKYYEIYTKKMTCFFKKFRTGDLLTRLTDDVDGGWDRISWYSCSGILRPIEAACVLIFTLSVMFYYSWELTLFAFIPLPFLVFIMAICQDKMVKYTDEKQAAISECNNVLEACFSGIRVIKTTLSEEDQLRKYEEALANRVAKEKTFLKLNQVMQFFSLLIENIGSVIVIFIGGYYVINDRISIGTLLLFIMYLQRLLDPIWTLSWSYASSKQVFRYVDRLMETESDGLDAEAESNSSLKEFNSLELSGVTYSFEDAQSPVLTDISLELKKGETLAIIGAVGSGKTSLLEVIAGNLKPDQGKVLVNGKNLNDYKSADFADILGYVRQENILFSETIRQNMELGNSYHPTDLESSLFIARMEDELKKFPLGLDTVLGQRGLSLSGGQKQRLSIARTLLRKPQLLLLDDCTAAMDATTEQHFWQAFKTNLPQTSCVIVTHRLATAKQADKIIVIDGNTIKECGTHEQLMCGNTLYKKLMIKEENAGSNGLSESETDIVLAFAG